MYKRTESDAKRTQRVPRKRTLARETALQALYQWEIRGKEIIPNLEDFSPPQSDDAIQEYARILTEGVVQHLNEIDQSIKDVATNWAVGRMAIIDRNILRIATYEIIFRDDIPKAVAINEAVELAKRYSTEATAAFVNGILDKLSKPSISAGDKPC